MDVGVFWLALAIFGVFVTFKLWGLKRKALSEPEARALAERGAVLVDVRTPQEYSVGHLPEALNLPVDRVVDGAAEAKLERHTPLVLYCASGTRSALAARKLRAAGYKEVVDIGTQRGWPLA